MRTGLLQLNVSDDPDANLPVTRRLICSAAEAGAQLILTPEVTNCVSASRKYQDHVLRHEHDDPTLAALREDAARLGVGLVIGSLALKTGDPDGRFANRCFVISPEGAIVASYDKIHMFDVQVSERETYCESKGYRPGTRAVVAETVGIKLGLSICYDIRFPYLYRKLAQAGAQILSVPSAFSPVTGAAHWEPLLRARAIETGCFVLAPAQTGDHFATTGKRRSTYGHSMVISPWGEIMSDAGTDPGLTVVDLDLDAVRDAKRRIASVMHDAEFDGPDLA